MFIVDAKIDEIFVDYFKVIDWKKVCPYTCIESEIMETCVLVRNHWSFFRVD